MVTTRAQARKNYKEPDSNDEFGTPHSASKKRRTRRNVSDNGSKNTKSKATKPKDTKRRVTKSKATKSKAAKSKVAESKVTESEATESRVTRFKAAKSKATESEATESKARKSRATRCRVIKTSDSKGIKSGGTKSGGTKSKVTKPNSNRRPRRRSPSAVLRGNPDATFSRLPPEIHMLISEQAARAVYKPIHEVLRASWRSHEYDSGIAHVNYRMREIAPKTLAALDRSEKAVIWLDFYDVLSLPRLLHLIAEAYSLSNPWAVDPFVTDNRPDWQLAQASYTFTVGCAIEYYRNPRSYTNVYRRLAHGPNSSKLDSVRRGQFGRFPDVRPFGPRDALDDRGMHALRAFVERTIERMRYPRHVRGALEVRLMLADLTNPDWRALDRSATNTPDSNRQQLLRVLHQLQKDFSEEIRVNFVLVDTQDPDEVPDFDRPWRETIDEYERLLTSDWWDDEPLEVEFVKMSPEEADEVFSWFEAQEDD